MRLALQRRVNSRERKLRVLPVILPGGQRAEESELPGFLQGTTWVEFRRRAQNRTNVYNIVISSNHNIIPSISYKIDFGSIDVAKAAPEELYRLSWINIFEFRVKD
jgi:hypothetical protein